MNIRSLLSSGRVSFLNVVLLALLLDAIPGFGASPASNRSANVFDLCFDSNVVAHSCLITGDIDDDGDIDLIWIADDGGKFVTSLGDGHENFSLDAGAKSNLNPIRVILQERAPPCDLS